MARDRATRDTHSDPTEPAPEDQLPDDSADLATEEEEVKRILADAKVLRVHYGARTIWTEERPWLEIVAEQNQLRAEGLDLG